MTIKLKIQPLNTCGKLLNAKTRIASDAAYILENLQGFLSVTTPPAPRGAKRKYQLSTKPGLDRFNAASGERRLEATLYEKYSGEEMLHASFSRIAAFQTPLYSAQKKEGWGAVDLLAIDRSGYPAVIELKIVNKKGEIESPLRAMVESLAYMIALRAPKNWTDFRTEWGESTQGHALPVPKELHAIVVAPENYWRRLKEDRHHRAALPNLQALVDSLGKNHGYIFHFLSIQATDSKQGGAWDVGDKHSEVQLSSLWAQGAESV